MLALAVASFRLLGLTRANCAPASGWVTNRDSRHSKRWQDDVFLVCWRVRQGSSNTPVFTKLQLCLTATVHISAHLFILLFSSQFSFFLWTPLRLFLFFPFAFIFASPVTHICFSVIENVSSCPLIRNRLDVFGTRPFLSPCFGV